MYLLHTKRPVEYTMRNLFVITTLLLLFLYFVMFLPSFPGSLFLPPSRARRRPWERGRVLNQSARVFSLGCLRRQVQLNPRIVAMRNILKLFKDLICREIYTYLVISSHFRRSSIRKCCLVWFI